MLSLTLLSILHWTKRSSIVGRLQSTKSKEVKRLVETVCVRRLDCGCSHERIDGLALQSLHNSQKSVSPCDFVVSLCRQREYVVREDLLNGWPVRLDQSLRSWKDDKDAHLTSTVTDSVLKICSGIQEKCSTAALVLFSLCEESDRMVTDVKVRILTFLGKRCCIVCRCS